MIENGELQFISVNSSVDSKKGVIVTLDDDEYLIIMDTIRKIKHKEFDNDDEEDESDDDAELEAEIDDELVIEEVGEAEEVEDVEDLDDEDDEDDDDIDKEEID
ncbi:MAG: hypothetical protein CO118_11525 [Flavobacteriales bacterium CG_4_9_14_3_um_filter_32_8]|nr:MAG: hypothetical protein CO118_11525 [Flavobacteriales bacterium CG_4_9_14_3_um_filter_32_8]